jgi:hypothetical protein
MAGAIWWLEEVAAGLPQVGKAYVTLQPFYCSSRCALAETLELRKRLHSVPPASFEI